MFARFDKIDKALKAGEEKMENHLTELKKSLDKKIKSCVNETSKVTARVVQLDQKVDEVIDKQRRICNLVINGIPVEDNENTKELFAIIASKLGYDNPPETIVYRARGIDNQKRPIFVKFATEFHKEKFFERYVKVATTLTLEGLKASYDSKSRYYIHHDLTKMQYNINKRAQQLRKEGLIKQVKIIHGNVAAKFEGEKMLSYFATLHELEVKCKPPSDDGEGSSVKA